MRPVRKWGLGPYTVAVIHGGPGAPGEMAPVARQLSTMTGVLEPFQSALTVDGQVKELQEMLVHEAQAPVTLVGFSWGALLSWMTAARYPSLVRKLVLVSSAPFEESYARSISRTRLDRMSAADRAETKNLMARLEDPDAADKDTAFTRLGILLARADACDPVSYVDETFHAESAVFREVWAEASALRSRGVLTGMARAIRCPVIAIHGDYDPHPAAGVEEPLSRACTDFSFVLLPRCGHRPWIERSAADAFYEALFRAVKD